MPHCNIYPSFFCGLIECNYTSSVHFKRSTIEYIKLSIQLSDTQASTLAYAPSTSTSLDQAASASTRSSVDGWGELEDGNIHEENSSDKDGWDDVDPFEDKPSPSLLSNIQAAQKRPVVQPKQPGKLLSSSVLFCFMQSHGHLSLQLYYCKHNQV
jgi:hypothetical protein